MAIELGPTGKAVWSAYGADLLDAGAQSLVRELARCADTLDHLDDLVIGERDAWVSVTFDDMGDVHLQIDKVLDQRRNHQLALKAIYGELRMAGIKAATLEGKLDSEQPKDMLAALRKAKESRERQSG